VGGIRKILNLSGGGTRISGLAGACDYIFNILGYRPTDISGISSGAILAIPIALRKWDIVREFTQTFTIDNIFDKKPINGKNKLSLGARLRAIFGHSSFGTQNNLLSTINKIVSEEEYKRFQNGDFPNVWIGSVDFKSSSRFIVNIKDEKYTYDDFLKLINASASIPLAVEGVHFNDMILYDGGVRNHILSHWMLENIPNVSENISIFARPKKYEHVLDNNWCDCNIVSVFTRLTDITAIEISKKDEIEENYLIEIINNKKTHKIKSKQIFIPYVIKELYGVNPTKLRKLYNFGFKSATNALVGW
jgi:predicted patatin/cPLA2 family phospholipase